MRVLIVKLSSLGDVVHAMPAVQDMLRAQPDAIIDWAVEPAFAPLVRRVQGVANVIETPFRRWRRALFNPATWADWGAWKATLQHTRYDAIIDLQGLTKSALVARLACGERYGLAHATDGSSWEAPARWWVQHPLSVPRHVHAVERSRLLVARIVGSDASGAARYGLLRTPGSPDPGGSANGVPEVVFVHGTSRPDKQWPTANWLDLGRRFLHHGWRIELPQGSDAEAAWAATLAQNLTEALPEAERGRITVWPRLSLDALLDRMAACQGVIGVDSGLSHLAVALDLPHVQIYNLPTAWRTGPPTPDTGSAAVRQVAVFAEPSPSVQAVEAAWNQVWAASSA